MPGQELFLSWSAEGQHEHQIAHSGYGNAIVCLRHFQPLCVSVMDRTAGLQKPHQFLYAMEMVCSHQL